MVCKACSKDSDAQCAFENNEFKNDNWCCSTLQKLWNDAYDSNTINYNVADEQCAVIPTELGFIVLARYKNRGRTTTALFLDSDNEPRNLKLSDIIK